MPWLDSTPGIKMKWLYKDNEKREAVCLMDASPGATIPDHIHTGLETRESVQGRLPGDRAVRIRRNRDFQAVDGGAIRPRRRAITGRAASASPAAPGKFRRTGADSGAPRPDVR